MNFELLRAAEVQDRRLIVGKAQIAEFTEERGHRRSNEMIAILPEFLEVLKIGRVFSGDALIEVEEDELIFIGVVTGEDALLTFQASAEPDADGENRGKDSAARGPMFD